MKNSGDTTWVTQKVIREYTAGRRPTWTAPSTPSAACPSRRRPSRFRISSHEIRVPVRLLVGGVPHPSGVKTDERELLAEKIPDFSLESVPGAGQFVQEEQPERVLKALGDLDQVAE